MPVSMSQARQICTKSELALVLSATTASLNKHSAQELRSRADRTRRLRDKYHDLASRQRREARGKSKPRGAQPAKGNERTVLKKTLFAETLSKFEAQIDRIKRAEPAASPKAAQKQARLAKPKRRTKAQSSNSVAQQSEKKPSAAAPKAKQAKKAKPAVRPLDQVPVNEYDEKAAAESTKNKLKARRRKSRQHESTIEALASSQSLSHHSEASRGARVHKAKERQNLQKIFGHVSARGRRRQAKRDSKQ